jgi:hypothetical protein
VGNFKVNGPNMEQIKDYFWWLYENEREEIERSLILASLPKSKQLGYGSSPPYRITIQQRYFDENMNDILLVRYQFKYGWFNLHIYTYSLFISEVPHVLPSSCCIVY